MMLGVGRRFLLSALKQTASFGLSEYQALEEWLGRADKGLYQAKTAGRNQVKAEKLEAFSLQAFPHTAPV